MGVRVVLGDETFDELVGIVDVALAVFCGGSLVEAAIFRGEDVACLDQALGQGETGFEVVRVGRDRGAKLVEFSVRDRS